MIIPTKRLTVVEISQNSCSFLSFKWNLYALMLKMRSVVRVKDFLTIFFLANNFNYKIISFTLKRNKRRRNNQFYRLSWVSKHIKGEKTKRKPNSGTNTFAKYFAGFSAHCRIVKSASSNFPEVSLFTACYNFDLLKKPEWRSQMPREWK